LKFAAHDPPRGEPGRAGRAGQPGSWSAGRLAGWPAGRLVGWSAGRWRWGLSSTGCPEVAWAATIVY